MKSWLLLCKRGGNSKQLTNQPFAGTTELKRIFSLLLSGILLSGVAFAQSNVETQQVSINVAEIAVIAVQGNVSMTINAASAIDLVTNVTKVRGTGLSLSYEAVATVEADVANTSRTVTYTITNN